MTRHIDEIEKPVKAYQTGLKQWMFLILNMIKCRDICSESLWCSGNSYLLIFYPYRHWFESCIQHLNYFSYSSIFLPLNQYLAVDGPMVASGDLTGSPPACNGAQPVQDINPSWAKQFWPFLILMFKPPLKALKHFQL